MRVSSLALLRSHHDRGRATHHRLRNLALHFKVLLLLRLLEAGRLRGWHDRGGHGRIVCGLVAHTQSEGVGMQFEADWHLHVLDVAHEQFVDVTAYVDRHWEWNLDWRMRRNGASWRFKSGHDFVLVVEIFPLRSLREGVILPRRGLVDCHSSIE